MLSRLGFDFVSERESDGIIVLAAKQSAAARRTIALVGWPAPDDLRQVLCRCHQTLGCDGALFICHHYHSVKCLTRRLCRVLPAQLTERVGVITQSAWEMLLANLSAKPTPSRSPRIRGLLPPPPEMAVPRPVSLPHLLPIHYRFLRDVLEHPFTPLSDCYRRLALGLRRGYQILCELRTANCIHLRQKRSKHPKAGRPRIVLRLSPHGQELLKTYLSQNHEL